MATYSSVLAWRIPGTGEVVGLIVKALDAHAWYKHVFICGVLGCRHHCVLNTSPDLKNTAGGLLAFAAAAMSLQSCPTLCYPIDGSPPGSPVPGILQARTLE